jgi:GT2 family glycosyltransferase
VSPIARKFDEDPAVGVIGPKILFPDGLTIQSVGGRIAVNGFTEHFGYLERDAGQWDEVRDVDYAPGACLGIRRDLFERCLGFDDGYYPAYYEETELCTKVRKLGFRVLCLPSSRVFHLGGHSVGIMSYNYFYWFHKHRLRYVLKNQAATRIFSGAVPREAQWFFRLFWWWAKGRANRVFRGIPFPADATEERYERGFHAVCKAYGATLATFPSILHARWFRYFRG